MSVLNAKKFILKCKNDSSFRSLIYGCKSKQEIICAAAKAGIEFAGADTARAFAELKTQVQDEDELDELTELKMWYEMQTGGEEPDPLSICSSCSVRGGCTNYAKLQSGITAEKNE
jgi:predicted ribosomally synthesized peptide with nif11-like leader